MELLLKIVAAIQLGIAILNFFLPNILKWQADLERLPLLIQQVFYVHSWFISTILTIFAILTWRFNLEMISGTNSVAAWLAVSIGIFWLFRAILQITYYSSSHWLGNTGRTLAHIGCLVVYGGMAIIYFLAAMKGDLL